DIRADSNSVARLITGDAESCRRLGDAMIVRTPIQRTRGVTYDLAPPRLDLRRTRITKTTRPFRIGQCVFESLSPILSSLHRFARAVRPATSTGMGTIDQADVGSGSLQQRRADGKGVRRPHRNPFGILRMSPDETKPLSERAVRRGPRLHERSTIFSIASAN